MGTARGAVGHRFTCSISEAETHFALALLDQGVQETDILEVGEFMEIPQRSQH